MKTAGILLAAGESKRFGSSDKLMAMFKGRPLIAHAAETLRDFAPDYLVAVVSNPDIATDLHGFTSISPDDENPSQSASIRAGVTLANQVGADRVVIALADMPFVTSQLLRKLLAKCTDSCSSASTDDKRRSPPACFPREQFEALSKLQGDKGARDILGGLPSRALVSVDRFELADIDSLDDLETYG